MIDKSDILGLSGFLLVFCGAWMIFPPAALLLAGVLLLVAAVLNARR